MENNQSQKAGDNSQQIQMVNPTILIGIDEKRVREVCSEIALETIKQYTKEASAIATARIEKLTTNLIPRIEKIENDFKSFSDPSFQFELRNAQKIAACTDSENDYKLLSELLVHRIEKKDDRKTKASISKAIEIVDQIDDDALCGLTLVYIINRYSATSGNISAGLECMNEFFSSLCYRELPSGFRWMFHLDMLNAARVIPIGEFEQFRELYQEWFEGYTCVGIKKESETYQCAINILKSVNLPIELLVDHELNEGYVRLNVKSKNAIKDINFPKLIQTNTIETHKLTDSEVNALNKIWNLYLNDSKIKNNIINTFMQKWNSYNTLKEVRLWWESLHYRIFITPMGEVLAHTNAQRHYNGLPDLNIK